MGSEKIESMFSDIAGRYDVANDALSFGTHKRWRRLAVSKSAPRQDEKVLDVCCGTGDFAIEYGAACPSLEIVAVDISDKMIDRARQRVESVCPKCEIRFNVMDARELEFAFESFDIVSCGFGIRNIPEFRRALCGFYKVLKPRGRLVVLEFSMPEMNWRGKFYKWYFTKVLPILGGWITKNHEAYDYLARSVIQWKKEVDLKTEFERQGFTGVERTAIYGGVAEIILGYKAD